MDAPARSHEICEGVREERGGGEEGGGFLFYFPRVGWFGVLMGQGVRIQADIIYRSERLEASRLFCGVSR